MTGKKIKCLNFGSYNYLGFSENHGVCAEATIHSSREFGIATCASRLELGTANHHSELERLVARFVGTEDAITCGMGFATNTLNIPSILGKGCLVISDEKNHASIILGLRLSGASIRVFKHNSDISFLSTFFSKFLRNRFHYRYETLREATARRNYLWAASDSFALEKSVRCLWRCVQYGRLHCEARWNCRIKEKIWSKSK